MNRTHYMKWGVNISLHNSGCCRRSVVPRIAVLSRHTELTKRVIYKFTFLWLSAKQGTTNSPTSHLTHLYTVHCLVREKNTDGSAAESIISLANVCYDDSRFAKYFLRLNLIFQPIWGWGYLGFFQHRQSNFSTEGAWNLGGLYLSPHEDNSIQLLSIANN